MPPNMTIPRIGHADCRPQFADGTRPSPRRSAEAEMWSQGMRPSVRDRDLVTFCLHPIPVWGRSVPKLSVNCPICHTLRQQIVVSLQKASTGMA